METKK